MAACDDAPGQTVPHAGAAPGVRQVVIWAATGAVIVVGVALLGLDKPLYILGFGLLAFGLAQIVHRWRLAARADRLLNHILSDLNAMPPTMQRLAVIQFLSWFAMVILCIYANPVVAASLFGATDPTTPTYQERHN